MKYLSRCVIGIVILTFLTFSVYFFWPSKKTTLILSAGETSGVYYVIGHSIAELVNSERPDIHIKVVESRGSFDNLRRIRKPIWR